MGLKNAIKNPSPECPMISDFISPVVHDHVSLDEGRRLADLRHQVRYPRPPLLGADLAEPRRQTDHGGGRSRLRPGERGRRQLQTLHRVGRLLVRSEEIDNIL